MYTPITIGIIVGIITCFFIKNPKTFIEPYIVFGSIYFIIVFSYISLKVSRLSFIKKNPLHFLLELLFIGLFSYLFCIIFYYFRGMSIKKDNIHFVVGSIFFIIVHILIEISGLYDR
jgi:uncharacterized BrkB/YihY/UPF0761 family membrane protein